MQHYIGYDKIWELSDSAGRDYLLCYNGETDIDMGFYPFRAVFFLGVGGEYQEVCSSEDWKYIPFYCFSIPKLGKSIDKGTCL